ncbi:MAG: hypothetical protein U9R74_16685 [Pseudomonadota bacterium]|nr:hypothetical protein [Pseudomonadota bacterium]
MHQSTADRQRERLMTIALRIFEQAFAPEKYRSPRSHAYKSGVLCFLRFKAGEIAHPDNRIPYPPGSAESDAWYAGMDEGYARWRSQRNGSKHDYQAH